MRWNTDNIADQGGKTFVVTGGNTGIGFAAVKALASKRARVILACRSLDKGNAALAAIKVGEPDADVKVARLDLASLAAVAEFADWCTTNLPRIDVLINNAGVMDAPLSRTADGFEMHFGTNVLGHFALTGRLMPLLLNASGSRIVTMSSVGHWFGKLEFDNLNAEKPYNRIMAYAQSKLADLVFAHELQRRLARAGSSSISVGAHPGVTSSDLGRNAIHTRIALRIYGQSALNGALPALMGATSPDIKGGDYVGPGGFLTFKGPPIVQKSRALSRDLELGSRLWAKAQEMTQFSYL
jgi:NAD(P)-dependent dehydrogenase (short-subunit alcohol dehydrogenase family)